MYGRIWLKGAKLSKNEHRNDSYHHPPRSSIWRWRRLLVFPTPLKRKILPDADGLQNLTFRFGALRAGSFADGELAIKLKLCFVAEALVVLCSESAYPSEFASSR